MNPHAVIPAEELKGPDPLLKKAYAFFIDIASFKLSTGDFINGPTKVNTWSSIVCPTGRSATTEILNQNCLLRLFYNQGSYKRVISVTFSFVKSALGPIPESISI